MSARSTRRLHAQVPLNNIESLLLAQAVWELGAGPNSWASIAKILSKHPLLSRPKSFFSTQSCHSMYEALMEEAGLEMAESNNAPHAPVNLQLAQKHYRSRFLELQDLILTEESKFKTVLQEIDEIRAGLWDKNFQAKDSSELPVKLPHQATTPLPADKPAEELFGGSDLSGVTESAESNDSPETQEGLVSYIASEEQEQEQKAVPQKALYVEIEDDGQTERIGKSPSPSPVSQDSATVTPVEIAEIVEEAPESDNVEGVAEEQPPVAIEVDEELPCQPPELTSAVETDEDNVEQSEPEADVPMDGIVIPETDVMEEDIIRTDEQADQQEEEEEAVHKQEESKEEEEEPSQELDDGYRVEEVELEGQEEDLRGLEQEREEEEEEVVPMHTDESIDEEVGLNSPKSAQPVDVETESEPAHTPAAETIAFEEAEPIADDGQSSETEEPVAPTRRSTRRRKSSAASVPPLQTRTRLRSQARLSETELQLPADSENDGDTEVKENTPAIEDEHASSPFDGAVTRRRDGKRKASFLESAGSPQDKKRLREDSEPIDEEEPGPSSHSTRTRVTRHATKTEEQVALKRFQNVIGMLHSQISQHRNGNIFHNPIKNSEAPDYHEIVKRPMDLKTIKTRVKDGVIANSLEFQRDIYLMFANAMMYNRPGSDVHAMAEDMMLESEGQITAFRQTEGLVKRGQRP